MPDIWSPPPRFVHGQVLSAGGHLNALNKSLRYLHDDLLGYQMPFCGINYAIEGWTYRGAVRHKANMIEYQYEIPSGPGTGNCWITMDDEPVEGTLHNGAGLYSGVILLMNDWYPEPDSFYELSFGGTAKPKIWLLRENNPVFTWGNLPTFDDETTPSAADWQALSDAANGLRSILAYPRAPVARTPNRRGQIWNGTIKHTNRYLWVDTFLYAPGKSNDDGSRWTEANVYVNDTLVGIAHNGTNWVTPHAPIVGVNKYPYTLTIDLTDCGVSLNYGQDYHVWVEVDSSTEGWGSGSVFGVGEIPAESPEIEMWAELSDWEHGDYVRGQSGLKPANVYAWNLNLMTFPSAYNNYPCPKAVVVDDWQWYMRRKHRWLWYKNAEKTYPKIGFNYKNRTVEMSLPDSQEWKSFDLDQVPGLWPGTAYLLAGMTYAIEDITG